MSTINVNAVAESIKWTQAKAIGESEYADFHIGQLVGVNVKGNEVLVLNPVTGQISLISMLSAKRILRTLRNGQDKAYIVKDLQAFISYAQMEWTKHQKAEEYKIAKQMLASGRHFDQDDFEFIDRVMAENTENGANLTGRQEKQITYLTSLIGNEIYSRNTEHQMICKCGSSCIYQTVEGAIEFVERHAGHATWHSIIHKS